MAHDPHATTDLVDATPLDAANQQLAEALRKSFWVLKVIMIVLVVLYFLSGWFSVKSGEQGFITRFGRVLGAGVNEADAVLGPGWHWSWPYPFDRWQTLPTSERELPASFMFAQTDEEKVKGTVEYKYNMLSPLRDDYLITGDVNIIHVSLVMKYRIGDPIAYARNVYPAPASDVGLHSPPYKSRPEYGLLSSLLRNAVIEVAANRKALSIRGEEQEEFLRAVAQRMSVKLKEFEDKGTPLGIVLDAENAVLAPKIGMAEAIRPPAQVQEEFDRVFSKQNEKARMIAAAAAEATERLTNAAGMNSPRLVEAIDEEFRAMGELSEANSGKAAGGASPEVIAALSKRVDACRTASEALLDASTGQVQTIIKNSQVYRDQMINEAVADHEHVRLLAPEYTRNKEILLSRLRDEIMAEALRDPNVAKLYLPSRASQYWIKIPREKLPPASQIKATASPFVSSTKLPATGGGAPKAEFKAQRK